MSVAEMPSHYHLPNQTSGGFVLNAYNNAPTGNYNAGAYVGTGGLLNPWASSTGATGGSTPMSLMQPYAVQSVAVRF